MVTALTRLTPPIKWHGGKHYLASKIVALMPAHTHYVEPFAGGLSVLLAKNPEGISEVANDLNGALANFWQVLRDDESFDRFRRRAEATPFSERVWTDAMTLLRAPLDIDPVEWAWAFFVGCRQSLAGRMDHFAPLSRTRTRRGMNEQASAWLGSIDGLGAVHARLKRVVILNRPALDVIRQQDGPNTLHYLDPPYLLETRASKDVYEHEMSAGEHEELLDAISACQGKVMISGYASEMYARKLLAWTRHEFPVPNQAAGGKSKRLMTEIVWCNF